MQVDNNYFRAALHCKVDDHPGLNVEDIHNSSLNPLCFLHSWFLLKRYNQSDLKSFMTNIETTR
ncbi:DUF3289 family protein [Tatumella sp. JGM118]|uniref:DUF3289 family protein n=1 Tax=Tatumella sp. JGM118 TaxID=2799796 RepID=UPI0035302EF4